MSKRTQLDHLHQQILGEIDSLTARLEAVSSQADDFSKQLHAAPAAVKREMGEAAKVLRNTVTALRPDGAQFVNLGPNALAGVRSAVSASLMEWNQNFTAEVLGTVTDMLKKIAKTQDELLRQQQAQQKVEWKRVGAYAAACLVSAIIGGLVSWALI